MPPTSTIREQILDQVETALKAVEAGSTYFTTFPDTAVERMRSTSLNQLVYPAVKIWEGPEEKSTNAVRGNPVPIGMILCILTLEIHFFFRADASQASEDGNEIIHDIEVAMNTLDGDTIGGVLVRIESLGNFLTLAEPSDPEWEGVCVFEVIYRHKRGDPSTIQ